MVPGTIFLNELSHDSEASSIVHLLNPYLAEFLKWISPPFFLKLFLEGGISRSKFEAGLSNIFIPHIYAGSPGSILVGKVYQRGKGKKTTNKNLSV